MGRGSPRAAAESQRRNGPASERPAPASSRKYAASSNDLRNARYARSRGTFTTWASDAAAKAASATSLTGHSTPSAIDTRAPPQAAPLRRTARRPAPRSSLQHASLWPGRVPRAAAARPPGRGARSPPSTSRPAEPPAARVRLRRGSAPPRTPRPVGQQARQPVGRGIATIRSNRSRRARESLSRNAASRCGEHLQSAAGSPRAPHGQRFIAATSWNLAGKVARPPTRAMLTTPSSSG